MSRYITVSADVDVYLDEIDTDDLMEELESRGVMLGADSPEDNNEMLTKIWELRRLGKPFDRELDQLIYSVLGKGV